MPSSPRLRTTSFLGNFLGAIFSGSAKCLISWSEWQDLNLRPPRPERGVLRRKPQTFENTRHASIPLPQPAIIIFTICHCGCEGGGAKAQVFSRVFPERNTT